MVQILIYPNIIRMLHNVVMSEIIVRQKMYMSTWLTHFASFYSLVHLLLLSIRWVASLRGTTFLRAERLLDWCFPSASVLTVKVSNITYWKPLNTSYFHLKRRYRYDVPHYRTQTLISFLSLPLEEMPSCRPTSLISLHALSLIISAADSVAVKLLIAFRELYYYASL